MVRGGATRDTAGSVATDARLLPMSACDAVVARVLRVNQPPALLLGAQGKFFPPAAARAYLRDLPEAELHLLDTGHPRPAPTTTRSPP